MAVDAHGTDGSTPLHQALKRWGTSLAAAETLLEAGADVNAPDGWGRTSLHLAVADGHNIDPAALRRFLARLLSSGADPDVQDNMGWTPLHLAAYREDPSLAATLLEAGADVTLRTRERETPLHPAARHTGPATIAVLLRGGVDVHTPDESGDTPLHAAAEEGTPTTVEALLAAGADIHAKNASGNTPLHSATRHSWRQSALGQQAPRVDTAVVRILIQTGADVHARNVGGGTPLHAAWSEGNVLVADRLVAMGADPDALDAAGRPAGDPACDWQEWGGLDRSPVESVRGCLEKGTDPNARDEYGGTPLHRLVGPGPPMHHLSPRSWRS